MDEEELEGYSIQRLAEKAGVSIRTIRFYIDEGLLAAPPVKGKYAVYNDEYLDRLEMIRRLKDVYLPLKEIRERVSSLSWEEVKGVLAQTPLPAPRQSVAENSALDYISAVLSAPPPPPRAKAQPPAPIQPEEWERLTIVPGIELHIRRDVLSTKKRLVPQLIDYIRKLFA